MRNERSQNDAGHPQWVDSEHSMPVRFWTRSLSPLLLVNA
jgi:hypothetical protein